MHPIILVMSGGAIGAALRYGLSRALPISAAGWPWPTFAANVAGGLCMGVLAMFGKLKFPGKKRLDAARCSSCGRFNIGTGPCACGKGKG